jgi:hypothetical protein
VQDLLLTALVSPTGQRPLDLPTCSAPRPRRLRAARHLAALAATERRIKGRRALAPARAAAGRLRRACARRCRVLRRRLGPRAGAAPDQGARGAEGEGGNAPGLGPAAEPSCGASMPAAAGRANWSARFTLNCAGLAHWQAAPGRAHLLRGACARRDAWRRLRGESRQGRPGKKNKNKKYFWL